MDKFDPKVVVDENLMIDYICSEGFSEELLNFLCETNYLECISEERTPDSQERVKKILDAVVKNRMIPYRIFLLIVDLSYDATNNSEVIFKNYLNNVIYDLSDHEFSHFFDNVLKKLHPNFCLLFAELNLNKNLALPRVIYEYLAEKDGVNLLRLLIKYKIGDINLVFQLIRSRIYIPFLELVQVN